MKKLLTQILLALMSIQPLCASAADISIFGDILVLHASQESASTWASVISFPTSGVVDFDVIDIDFNWNPGFRGGFVFEPSYTPTDTKISWTYFYTKDRDDIRLAEQIIAPEFFSGFTSGNVFFGGKIDWRLTMNMVDFDIGRKINIGKSITIRPSVGIKGGTIRQTIDCTWDALLFTATERVIHNYSGVGPTMGVGSTWNIYKSLSLIGDFSAAFMWGDWKITDTYVRPAAPLITPTTITTTTDKNQLGTVTFDYFMGLKWADKKFSMQLGYEMQYWANQLRVVTFQQLPVHGSLTLQGGKCHIRLDL